MAAKSLGGSGYFIFRKIKLTPSTTNFNIIKKTAVLSPRINSMFEYRLILQTSEAAKHTGLQGNLLQLNRFTGHEICCAIELDGHGSFVPGMPGTSGLANRGAGTRYIAGFIESTIFHGEDNHQALFEFVLRPWLHVACLRSDRRIYQNITAVDAIRAIL